mgnify:FL=1
MSQGENKSERPWWLPKDDAATPASAGLPFGADVKGLLSGAQRVVEWVTHTFAETMLEPHGLHEVPDSDCALCQAEMRLMRTPSGTAAPVIVWHSARWKGSGAHHG